MQERTAYDLHQKADVPIGLCGLEEVNYFTSFGKKISDTTIFTRLSHQIKFRRVTFKKLDFSISSGTPHKIQFQV